MRKNILKQKFGKETLLKKVKRERRRLTFQDENYRIQKQPPRGIPRKRCSENMQQVYRRTPIPKCDFNSNCIEITLRYGCSPVNLLRIFRTPFLKNTSEWLLLRINDEVKTMKDLQNRPIEIH